MEKSNIVPPNNRVKKPADKPAAVIGINFFLGMTTLYLLTL